MNIKKNWRMISLLTGIFLSILGSALSHFFDRCQPIIFKTPEGREIIIHSDFCTQPLLFILGQLIYPLGICLIIFGFIFLFARFISNRFSRNKNLDIPNQQPNNLKIFFNTILAIFGTIALLSLSVLLPLLFAQIVYGSYSAVSVDFIFFLTIGFFAISAYISFRLFKSKSFFGWLGAILLMAWIVLMFLVFYELSECCF